MTHGGISPHRSAKQRSYFFDRFSCCFGTAEQPHLLNLKTGIHEFWNLPPNDGYLMPQAAHNKAPIP
jgi:hypothetical protein